MRVAALYDVHGNLPALEAVLADLERDGGVDEIVVGGDVLWGPMQSECLSLLQNMGATFVSGNCERDVLSFKGSIGFLSSVTLVVRLVLLAFSDCDGAAPDL